VLEAAQDRPGGVERAPHEHARASARDRGAERPQPRGALDERRRAGIEVRAAGLVQPVANTVGWLFITQGRTREMFQWGLIGGAIAVASIVAGLPWGALGVATSYTVGYVLVVTPLLFWFVGRRGHVRARDIYAAVAPMFCAAACAAGAVLLLRRAAGPLNPLVGLAAGFAVAAVVALLLFALLPRGRRALQDLSGSLMLLAGRGRQVGRA
jgi:PST family polysaccharide transporter